MSQAAFAERLDVSVRTVSRWETGEGLPELDRMGLVSELLGKPVAWFFLSPDEERERRAQEQIWDDLSPDQRDWYALFAEHTREYGLTLDEFDISSHPGAPKWYRDERAEISAETYRVEAEAKRREEEWERREALERQQQTPPPPHSESPPTPDLHAVLEQLVRGQAQLSHAMAQLVRGQEQLARAVEGLAAQESGQACGDAARRGKVG